MKRRLQLTTGTALLFALAGPVGAQSIDRTVLPIADPPFAGHVGATYSESTPAFPKPVTAPDGAPNVLLILADDVGFAAASTFGGPVPTPNLDRLAARGLVYNHFHVSGICSPTRAALLTGRNQHAVATGMVMNMATGFPGYNARIPKSAATIAEVLGQNGYSTAMFGKNHNTPDADISAAGPFDRWPTGLGFDYFYGFMSDEADQFTPGLYRGTQRIEAPPNTIFEKAMANDAINWLHNQDAAATGRPFFIYYAPGSAHMPHQAPADWIARFRGAFDQGWDALRGASARRQIAMKLVPRGTVNTPRPEGVPAWDSLSPVQKRTSARFMEVYAAMLAYQDNQIGRLLDELDRMGKADNTLVMFIEGDNGAQAAPNLGSLNTIASYLNGIKESDEDLLANIDRIGGPDTLADYGRGWAWGTSAPFPFFKTFASHLGGTRSPMVVSWPAKIRNGGIRSQFSYVNDVMPTILEAAGLPAPTSVNGIKQQPIDGASLVYSFQDPSAPEQHRTQYFEVGGNRAIYHDGWWANTFPARRTFDPGSAGKPAPTPEQQQWELYNLSGDFSQSRNVAAQHPHKLAELRSLFASEARRNNVYPIDVRNNIDRFQAQSQQLQPLKRYTFWGSDVVVPVFRAPPILENSFTITADIEASGPQTEGTILALGGKFGGWSFFLKDGKPGVLMAASRLERDRSLIVAPSPIAAGRSKIRFTFQRGSGRFAGGTMRIDVNGEMAAQGEIRRTIAAMADPTTALSVGYDSDTPVTDFLADGGRLDGKINRVDVDIE
jgi:arylsulfatase A-like enzyme